MSSNKSNTQQALWVGVGSFASFGFVFLTGVVLSRYFSKEDYGTYRQVLYLYNTFLVVFTLGLPRAYNFFLARVTLEQAKDLVNKITLLCCLMGGIFSLFLFVSSPIMANVLNNHDLNFTLKIFSPVPLLMLPTMGIDSIYATYRKTHVLVIYTIITRVLMFCCIVLPVIFFDGNYISAIKGFLAASFLIFIVSLIFKNKFFSNYETQKCGYSYKQILNYTFPLMLAGISGLMISSSDQFFISRYFGMKTFAEFSNGFIELPFVAMILSANSIVLTPLYSKYISTNKIDAKMHILTLWNSSIKKTVMITYPMIIFCLFYSDLIIEMCFGVNYVNSAVYFRIKLFTNFFTVAVYSPLFLALGETKYYAKIFFYGMIIVIILEYFSLSIFNSPYAVVIVSVVCDVSRILMALLFVSKYFVISVFDLFPILLLFKIIIPSIVILSLIRLFLNMENIILNILIGLIIYMILYLICSYFVRIDYSLIFKSILKLL